jgi:hypothetical protein
MVPTTWLLTSDMKTRLCLIAFGLLAVGTPPLPAQVAGRGITLVPTNGIAAARSRVKQPDIFRIATNTLAFEEYGLNMMLAVANETRVRWKLDLPAPLTVNDALFTLTPTPYGIDGSLSTRDGRFNWSLWRNTFDHFQDCKYFPRSFRYKDAEEAKLAKFKSKITAKEAEAIARGVLHGLRLSEKQLRLKEPPAVNQYKFEETDGTVYPLPMFNVAWRVEGGDDDFPPVTVDVSGITKNVAEYFNVDRYAPRVPMPTNYFRLLGLPDNYLETIPTRQRLKWGLPALTNSPLQTTNTSR